MSIDSYLAGVLIIIVTNVLAVLGLLVTRRVLREKDLIASHDVGGYLLSVVGTMYAVTVGLIVVDSMSRFEDARHNAEQESNALADIILLSHQLPAEKQLQIRKLAQHYVERVIKDEWPAMNRGTYAPSARRAAIDFIRAVCDFSPKSEKESAIYQSAIDMTCRFWDSRRTRTLTASNGVPALEWVVLLAGSVITLIFTYLFKLDHLSLQIFMTLMVATIIAINLFLVLEFGYPFSGDLQVKYDCFEVIREVLDHNPVVIGP